MKKLLIALALAVPVPVNALFIDAELTSFQRSDVRLNGGAPAGGIGTFRMLTDVTGSAADFLGGSFLAACLEPNEFVSVGSSYKFEFVDLRGSPTSVIGGMGLEREQMVERIMTGLGWESIEHVVDGGGVGVSALSMVLYEAAFETEPAFDWSSGTAQVTGSGSAMAGAVQAPSVYSTTPMVEAFALLNTAEIPATGPNFTGQDFVVMRAAEETVSAPSAGMLTMLGLGMLGLTLTKRGKDNVLR